MVVEIDGLPVMSTYVEGVNQRIEAPVSLPPGNHTVRVSYDNDYYEPADAFTSTRRSR